MPDNIKITPIKNGPLMVEGKLKVLKENDELIKEGEKLFFCRCGHSVNKPFCDGSHKKVDFVG